MFIETFVLVVDAVEVQEVGDLALLEALDLLSLQRPDFVAANVVVICPPGLELVLAAIGRELFPELGQYGLGDTPVGDQFGDDIFQQNNQRLIICGRLGQRRAPTLHFADDREA